ncbi:MAG: hypothetical protein JW754_03965 [Candidatus Aenigmarchaeota archaeon]|nr:hypothetical protein [Candidatus Aenigmarchaeota archaeon]
MRRFSPRGPPGPPEHPVPPRERDLYEEPNHSDLMEAIERGFDDIHKHMDELKTKN